MPVSHSVFVHLSCGPNECLFSLLHFILLSLVFQFLFDSRFCCLHYCLMTYITSLFDECCFHIFVWVNYKSVKQDRTEKKSLALYIWDFFPFLLSEIFLQLASRISMRQPVMCFAEIKYTLSAKYRVVKKEVKWLFYCIVG